MFSEGVTGGEGEPERTLARTLAHKRIGRAKPRSLQRHQLSHDDGGGGRGGGDIWLGNHGHSEQMFIQTIVELPVSHCGLWCWRAGGVQSGAMRMTPTWTQAQVVRVLVWFRPSLVAPSDGSTGLKRGEPAVRFSPKT